MTIRTATIADFQHLYLIGTHTSELRVSSVEPFMDPDEFRWAITNPDGVFLVAEVDQNIVGFIYANTNDIEKTFQNKYACIVYLVVIPPFRRRGVAQRLYLETEKKLHTKGVSHLYCWAHDSGTGEIVRFMEKQGFIQGHSYRWMDKKI